MLEGRSEKRTQQQQRGKKRYGEIAAVGIAHGKKKKPKMTSNPEGKKRKTRLDQTTELCNFESLLTTKRGRRIGKQFDERSGGGGPSGGVSLRKSRRKLVYNGLSVLDGGCSAQETFREQMEVRKEGGSGTVLQFSGKKRKNGCEPPLEGKQRSAGGE